MSPFTPRRIVLDGYRRADGLFDVEARLTDTKSYGFPTMDRGWIDPGRAAAWHVHADDGHRGLDDRAFEAATDYSPYGICPAAAENFSRLAGIQIGRGFVRAAAERVGRHPWLHPSAGAVAADGDGGVPDSISRTRQAGRERSPARHAEHLLRLQQRQPGGPAPMAGPLHRRGAGAWVTARPGAMAGRLMAFLRRGHPEIVEHEHTDRAGPPPATLPVSARRINSAGAIRSRWHISSSASQISGSRRMLERP